MQRQYQKPGSASFGKILRQSPCEFEFSERDTRLSVQSRQGRDEVYGTADSIVGILGLNPLAGALVDTGSRMAGK